jgi:hypothetical protein
MLITSARCDPKCKEAPPDSQICGSALDRDGRDRHAREVHEKIRVDAEPGRMLPEGVREGDVLIYMGGRLVVVDHLVPEAYTINLLELETGEDPKRAT